MISFLLGVQVFIRKAAAESYKKQQCFVFLANN